MMRNLLPGHVLFRVPGKPAKTIVADPSPDYGRILCFAAKN